MLYNEPMSGKPKAKLKTKQVNIRLEDDIYDRLKEIADEHRVSVSWLVREYLLRELPPKE